MHIEFIFLQLFRPYFYVVKPEFLLLSNLYTLVVLFLLISITGVVSYILKIRYERKKDRDKINFLEKEKEFEVLIHELSTKINKQEILLRRQEKELIVHKRIKKLHDKIAEKILTQDDWYNFKETFNQVYPLFFKKIKEKNIHLTKSEERLVALEKLGLDNTQIAKVLGISVDSVFVNRYRLRKKIKAPNTISIVEFLESKLTI
ncbi:helix-turn-helix transcriptional regulator [Tenacibaculum agarivorans]|uniref:helix-turn-helix transcriptional regulator n=1 Tax=Tenacibaculum agarivorans TaxID=1908389 RepID=UPI00094BA4CD|nr:LuxR C-terminal-related transcriptional regulator [Tenacibaculum agarivorans]